MLYKYYVNCFKNGEPTYAAGYVEANNEEETIKKAIEPYDKNAYEFLELEQVRRGYRSLVPLLYNDCIDFKNVGIGEEVKFYDIDTETIGRT